ncbi:hypothetical protein [Terrimonas alba]|uniref:hypothetical protein n=1 Tax=Terrimonas alba TaxID=3349636 RepID=UPI0035F37A77
MKQLLFTLSACICCLIAISQQLKITPGTFLTNNNAAITVYNTSIQNDGSLSGSGGTIVFTGSNDNSISGNGSTNFHNIQLSKQAGSKLILQKNISASGAVTFNSGLIDLGNQQFELNYPGGLLQNENENSRIFTAGTGEIFITQNLNAPNNSNPGNLGVILSSTVNLGMTTVRRGHAIQTNLNQQQSINRYFNILPAVNSNLNAQLRYTYFDAELNNLTESSLDLFEKVGADDWKQSTVNGTSTQLNYKEVFGLAQLHKYSLFPLPDQSTGDVQIVCPGDVTVSTGLTQQQINTAFADWLDDVTATGGCNVSITNNNTGAPPACGGTVSVTFTATNTCGNGASCTASFTVPSTENIQLSCPSNTTVNACQTQTEVNIAFANWLALVTSSGGTITTTPANPIAPSACGGSITVEWKVTGTCSSKTCSATFTVAAAGNIVIDCPDNVTLNAGLTQQQINTAYDSWLASVTASSVCGLKITNNSTAYPVCGQTATVTWKATSSCGDETTCSATFTVPACDVPVETGEGCTPGYWKNHPKAWGCGYTTKSKFFDVFTVITNYRGLPQKTTMLDALNQNGGGYSALARHATGALLNACHNAVDYPYTPEEIKAAVVSMFNFGNAVIGNKTFINVDTLKNEFERANNLGCPLNNSNNQPSAAREATSSLPESFTQLKVAAYPNPFVDVVRFTIQSDVSGQARLDIVNMMGQKVATVYSGFIVANQSKQVEYRSATRVQENLIYIFTIGGKQVTGKLLQSH